MIIWDSDHSVILSGAKNPNIIKIQVDVLLNLLGFFDFIQRTVLTLGLFLCLEFCFYSVGPLGIDFFAGLLIDVVASDSEYIVFLVCTVFKIKGYFFTAL